MWIVILLMVAFIAYSLPLYVVSTSTAGSWALRAGVVCCLFSVIATISAFTGLTQLYAAPIAIGALGTVPIAVMAIVCRASGFWEGVRILARRRR